MYFKYMNLQFLSYKSTYFVIYLFYLKFILEQLFLINKICTFLYIIFIYCQFIAIRLLSFQILIKYTFQPIWCQKKDVESEMYNINQQLYFTSNAAHIIQRYLVWPSPIYTYVLHNRYLYYHFTNAYNCIFVAFFFLRQHCVKTIGITTKIYA